MLQKNWSELIKPTKMEVNVDETNGRIVLSLSSSETNGLPVGTAVYDLELVSTVGNSVVRLVQGNFTVGE